MLETNKKISLNKIYYHVNIKKIYNIIKQVCEFDQWVSVEYLDKNYKLFNSNLQKVEKSIFILHR